MKLKSKNLALCFYSHIASLAKELLLMPFMSLKKIKQKVELQDEDHIWNALNRSTNGAIILSGHFGNWELTGSGCVLNLNARQFENGSRIYVLRKNLKNKLVEKILFRNFYRVDVRIIPRKKSIKEVYEVLKRKNIVFFFIDQQACLQAKDGIAVDFFGKKAGTFKSPATLARRMKIPVLPSRFYRRQCDGKHICEFFSPVAWLSHDNWREEITLNTRKYNEIFEQFVLDYPEQWNWMHRRWREFK